MEEKLSHEKLIEVLRNRAAGRLVWMSDKHLLTQAADLLELCSLKEVAKEPNFDNELPHVQIERVIKNIHDQTKTKVDTIYISWNGPSLQGLNDIQIRSTYSTN